MSKFHLGLRDHPKGKTFCGWPAKNPFDYVLVEDVEQADRFLRNQELIRPGEECLKCKIAIEAMIQRQWDRLNREYDRMIRELES